MYCKYYEAFYIFSHTGMRISEFCGLTIKDIGFENNIVTIDHQLLRTSKMEYIIQFTRTGCRRWQCTGSIDSTTPCRGTTTFIGCRCRTLLLMCTDKSLLQYGESSDKSENSPVSHGHSDIGVTMNTYTHLGLEDAKDEMIRMEELNAAKKELEKNTGEKPVMKKMFLAI